MYRVTEGAKAPGSDWAGLSRIIGIEKDVAWLQHGGVPVASAMHLLRPASTAEMLACQVMSKNMRPTAAEPPPDAQAQQQQGYLDYATTQVEGQAPHHQAGPMLAEDQPSGRVEVEGVDDASIDSEKKDTHEEEIVSDTVVDPIAGLSAHKRPRVAETTGGTAESAATIPEQMMSPLERHLET